MQVHGMGRSAWLGLAIPSRTVRSGARCDRPDTLVSKDAASGVLT
jgi:hypothetical protein